MNGKEIKYFSMFTGVGGFELGLENSRGKPNFQGGWNKNSRSPQNLQPNRNKPSSQATIFNCVGFSEIDKYASELLKKRFPDITNYGDCTKIKPEELPDFDMLCGGFPCQAFSIAGKRRGFDDTRGTMFFEVTRIVKAKRPKIILLENVKGLLNHEKGQTFSVILQTLDELGYRTQWMVLNSKFFGVPQNRERVFIIGSLRGEPRPEVLPFEFSYTETNKTSEQVSSTINAGYYKIGGRDQQYIKVAEQRGEVMTKIAQPVLTPDRENARQNGRRFKEDGEPSFTLTGQDIHGVMVSVHNMQPRSPNRPSLKYSSGGSGHLQRDDTAYCLDGGNTNAVEFNNMKIRRLTPTECERLQGFPDGWTEGFSDTQRYKMMGNAVTVNVIKAIAEKLQ